MLDCESARRDTIALRANVDWGRHLENRDLERESDSIGVGATRRNKCGKGFAGWCRGKVGEWNISWKDRGRRQWISVGTSAWNLSPGALQSRRAAAADGSKYWFEDSNPFAST
jgi:hypothetical protein